MPSSSRDRQAPWPAQTPVAPPPHNHRRTRDRLPALPPAADTLERRMYPRDDIVDQDDVEEAMTECEFFSGNDVFSCWPTNNTSIAQHQFSSFVWNSRLPEFTQFNRVNIYLFSATSQKVLLQWNDVANPVGNAGVIHPQVNDTWWADRGDLWNGANLTFLYYYVVTAADRPLDNSVVPQPIFTAIQTTFADSIIASMSSTSAAAASSRSAASASSASAASAASASSASSSAQGSLGSTTTNATAPTATSSAGSGNVQSGNGSSPFPHWAIAVIVVLGFLALIASVILAFFIMRRVRRRQNSRLSHRGSMGSSTPMMSHAKEGEPTSPVVASAFGAAAGGANRPPSPEVHDGASTMSRTSDAALFSGADAAVMADAFRTALRKPNFADRPMEEGDSPDSDPNNRPNKETDLLNEALIEEGRDIRSVGSSRGVKVETLSDAGDNSDAMQERLPPR